MSPRKRRFGEKLRSLYLWHRYAGLLAALLVIWLALTGLVLNHTDDLRLDERFVQQRWLLTAYNITPPRDLHGWQIGNAWITASGGRIYLNETLVATGRATGAAIVDHGFVVSLPDQLLLFAPDATLIEAIPFAQSAGPITGLGRATDGALIIHAGERAFHADEDLVQFTPATSSLISHVNERRKLPAALQDVIAGDILRHTLTWERLLLDLHSGRILGRSGVWIADLAGLLLLLLAVSGVIVWAQRARARARHR